MYSILKSILRLILLLYYNIYSNIVISKKALIMLAHIKVSFNITSM